MYAARLLLMALFGLLAWGLLEPGRSALGALASSAALAVVEPANGTPLDRPDCAPGSGVDSCANVQSSTSGAACATLLVPSGVVTFASELYEIAEPQPEPLYDERGRAQRRRDSACGAGCSCRSAGRRAPNSGALLALLAQTAARARDGAAEHGAPA
jgi:hypothetical protein